MALSKDYIVKEESLCCSICLDVFDKPKTLPCLHSFCYVCLVGYIKKSLQDDQMIHCPLCRTGIRADIEHFDNDEKWVESLPVNFMLVSILNEKKHRMSDEVNYCGPCLLDGTNSQAVVQCFECSERFCENCRKFHQKMKSLARHKLYAIGDGKTCVEELEILRAITKCPEHQTENVRYICKDHDQLCCNECAIIKHRKCDHMVSIADEIAITGIKNEKTRVEIDKIDEKLKEMIEFEKMHQSIVLASVKEVDIKLKKVKKIIDEEFNKMKEAVKVEVTEKTENILKKSRMQTENIGALRSEVETCRGKLKAVFENGETVHLYLMERETKKDLVRLEEQMQRLARESSVMNVNVVENVSEGDLAKTIASCFHTEEKSCYGASFQNKDPVVVCERKLSVSRGSARACLWIENNIVITLQENKQIQLYHVDNEKIQFKNSKNTTSEPWSVTEVDNSKFAVCYPRDNNIEIMGIFEGCIQTTQKLRTDIDIWDVSFDKTNSEIIGLSRAGKVNIYKLDGTLVRSLPFSRGIIDALSFAYSICFDVHTRILYISSHGLHKVLAVELNGMGVFEYSGLKLEYPWYSDLDSDGNLWVPFYNYGQGNGVIHQVDRSGTLIREIKISGNGFCILFDKKKKRFLVLFSKDSGEHILQVCDWK